MNRGFTLVEMLVVVSIFGMISSVTVAALGNSRIQAKNARIRQETNHLREQLELSWNGSAYKDVLSTKGNSGTVLAQFPQGSQSAGAINLSNDILALNGGAYGGGVYESCVGSYLFVASYCVDQGYPGGSCPADSSTNGLSVFTNNGVANCNPAQVAYGNKYAIYAAFYPVGSAGYMCVDSQHNVVNRETGGIPSAPGSNVTCN